MKHIVLIEFTLVGHHYAFLQMFSEILLKQGHKVYALVPGAAKLGDAMRQLMPEKKDDFHAIDFKYEPRKQFPDSPIKNSISNLKKWHFEKQLVRGIEKQHGVKIDLVFYNWVDYQFSRYVPGFILDMVFPYKWSGLYFHPYHLRLEPQSLVTKANWRDYDSVFLANNCVAVTIHDTAIVDGFSRRIGKHVIHFPETATDTPPDYEYPLYKELMEKAAGRIIVGMVGCEIHKGTITMLRVAKLADPKKYFFAFLGVNQLFAYDEASKKELEDFVASAPENCFFKFESIPEGGAYNAIFCAFDIPFLVYNNFISSSNRLTKAAIFKRLVLASDNYCVGDDVRKFNLGEAVKPMDAEAAFEGLKKLTARIEAKDYPYEQWDTYCKLNSNEILDVRFREVISLTDK
jgi:hypothetical protein